ncbi:MAG: hypothetical protein L0191_13925 [Acidobacteria bacterium]|nr:hypothetical protein [Acidobacteriota bacterium]
MRRRALWRWLLAGLLLAAACWSANLTAYNWWAAGGPPTPHPDLYAARGNRFFFVTCFLLLAAVLLVWINVRARRRRSEPPSEVSPK